MEDSTILKVYGKGASEYEAVMRKYWHVERKPLVELLDLKPGMKALVAAVGTGLDLPYFTSGIDVIGIDHCKEMLEEARKKISPANVELEMMDIREMRFETNYFNAVLSTFTLCVLPDPVKGLEEIIRVAKPMGKIVIFDYIRSKNPEILKWQQLFHYHASNIGFPKNVICWDSLMDYDEIIFNIRLQWRILNYTRFENENPFLTSCQIVGMKK